MKDLLPVIVRCFIFGNCNWEDFYLYGSNPTPVPVEDPLGNFTTWTPFSSNDMAYLFVSNTTVEVRKEHRQRDYAYWRHYMPYLTKSITEDAAGKREKLKEVRSIHITC